ncbi:hypothetical protein F2P45_28550 [Massilia sp. CCM 8733]|uniref:DUF2116 family Zn-ribbon domain-containing protein n=1 Tax=Massilia mucilaginosa TaxID=2609282 RepID=A0ABX0P1V7_9BURK|nr:hypothetical protein [Massilia mucilaginosa]NHZ92929.1 hypothetical protein [Massilia mucilaginosa]
MGTIEDDFPEKDARAEHPSDAQSAPVRPRQALPPKGSCWYCEKPLDSVKRFCGKPCADAFDEEAEYTR